MAKILKSFKIVASESITSDKVEFIEVLDQLLDFPMKVAIMFHLSPDESPNHIENELQDESYYCQYSTAGIVEDKFTVKE